MLAREAAEYVAAHAHHMPANCVLQAEPKSCPDNKCEALPAKSLGRRTPQSKRMISAQLHGPDSSGVAVASQ
jgi:hypothetical protein